MSWILIDYIMSKVKALYHIVFCTKGRQMTLPLVHIEDLYRYIWKEITLLKCRLIRIGGIQNHVHMLVELHPSVALSKLMQNVKSYSSGWMRSDGRFPLFIGWANEYYASTISSDRQNDIVEYIKGQREHHNYTSFDKELKSLCSMIDAGCDDGFLM